MPRLTQIDDVLFPVEEYPVFVSVRTESGERRLSVPDKKAIVNTKTNRVLGVVSRGVHAQCVIRRELQGAGVVSVYRFSISVTRLPTDCFASPNSIDVRSR